MKQAADLILLNGTIYTVNDSMAVVQAMAIKDGKILAVGTDEEILAQYEGETQDLESKAVYPGLIDPHCHFIPYGRGFYQVDLTGTPTWQVALNKVAEFAQDYEGEWIQGRGWDQNDWPWKAFPNKTELDSLVPARPVILIRIDGHAALVNQKALDLAAINVETQVDGGEVKLKDGQPTGILIDNAIDLVRAVIPKDTELDYQAALKAQEECLKHGLTTVSDAWFTWSDFQILQQLQEEGQLKMRIYGMAASDEENKAQFAEHGTYESDYIHVPAFKYYTDGALGSRGAYLLSPYSDDLENQGLLLKPEAYFENEARWCYDNGWQMCTHAIGTGANQLVLDIYANVLGGPNDRRWRIEHCQIVHPDDMSKFSENDIVPSVQTTHATSDMYWAEERLGPERIQWAYPYQSLLQETGLLANGSDFPVESVNPLYGFYSAVTLQDAESWPEGGFLPEQRLSREEALKAMTIWAAYANFEEDSRGSLEPGKFADFVILDCDIMQVPMLQARNAKVEATYVAGEQVY